jgi:HD superfamily phosphohydrolase YqeK
VEELRKIAYLDLNKALIMSLENTIDYVEKRNMELDMESVKALNYLKEER